MRRLYARNHYGPGVGLAAADHKERRKPTSKPSHALQVARLKNLRVFYTRPPRIHVRSWLA
jgi:hypothetical protein